MIDIKELTIAEMRTLLAQLQEELRVILNPHTMTAKENEIYSQAKLNLGIHLTLDNAVAAEVGCAETVSKILSLAGIPVPSEGIAGTASLYEWLLTNPAFEKITNPEQGAIIISPTGMGNGSIEGHTGIIGGFGVQFPNDWGVCSNDSATGKFLETWSLTRWQAYYEQSGGLPIYLFRAL